MRNVLLLFLACLCALAQRPGGAPPLRESLRFKFMGPAIGNRISAAVGIPGDPSTYYVGAASGGVWKSTNAGADWVPIFDSQPVQAIGALAVSPTDPKQVWAGTGEAWAIRDSDMMGDGIYKSTDAGATWTHMGLADSGRIGRVMVHPANADTVFVCALGRLTGPQQQRGVFRTTDGGKNWERVLFVDENTGCSGLAMDPRNPRVMFAGTWQAEMKPHFFHSGGPGSGVYVSRDGGSTWKRIEGHGLPKPPVGKIDVAVAPSNPNRVFALIQTADQGSLWRSDDAGENWTAVSWQRSLIGRAGYYIRLAVSPTNENEVFVANSSFHRSLDGGKTFREERWGGDTHDIWIDPLNADRILVTHDAGMWMTTDHGRTSRRVTLPIGQMYHVAVDNDVPYKIYSNMQDNGTMRGPSNRPESGPNVPGGGSLSGRAAEPWEHGLGGCESGFTIPDLTDTNIVWATCYGNQVTRYDARTKLARSVSPWLHTLDAAPDQVKYRCHWSPPLALDPFDQKTVYYGCQLVLRTTNGGVSWTEISPDLSTKQRIAFSGGIIGDNLGQFYGSVIFAIAPSEIQKGLIWAGTNDGKVWYTRDGGVKWNDVSPANIPPWGVVSKIEPSHFEPGAAYMTVDYHLLDNRDPHVYKTTDFGKTWTSIAGNLPKGPLAYARAIAENPNKKGMLFVGTGNAFHYSMDDGQTWKQFKDGLPAAPVTWIAPQKAHHDVVISTYGRGLYILEDITPLEQETGAAAATRLYAPRPAYRLVRNARALLNYHLAEAAAAPPKLEILDAAGTAIREIAGLPSQAGAHRIAWDMRHEPPRRVHLRTTPRDNPHIWEEGRFQGAVTRPVLHWGIEPALVGPIAASGNYTVRLTVNGQSYTQPLEILLPPRNQATEADIRASVRLQLKVRDDINTVSDMANQLEWIRKHLEDDSKKVRQAELQKKIADMDQRLLEIESKLLTNSDMLSDDKFFISANKLYLKFIWLNGEIGSGAGDVAGTADYGPTETAIGLVHELERELQAVQAEYKTVLESDVPAYNATAGGSGLTALPLTPPPLPSAARPSR